MYSTRVFDARIVALHARRRRSRCGRLFSFLVLASRRLSREDRGCSREASSSSGIERGSTQPLTPKSIKPRFKCYSLQKIVLSIAVALSSVFARTACNHGYADNVDCCVAPRHAQTRDHSLSLMPLDHQPLRRTAPFFYFQRFFTSSCCTDIVWLVEP